MKQNDDDGFGSYAWPISLILFAVVLHPLRLLIFSEIGQELSGKAYGRLTLLLVR